MATNIDPIETARELATHTNDIKHLQDDMDKMVEDIKEIKQTLQAIQKLLDEQIGGRRVLYGAISAAGVVGGAIAWIAERVFSK
jgi:hypothetical protein